MRHLAATAALVVACALSGSAALAGPTTTAIRETAEYVLAKFGKGAAGQTAEEVSASTAKALARHGEDAAPLLKAAGHSGYVALEEAGARAPEVIKLFAKRGDEAVWLISQPKKLAIFLKHGDNAADALIKHPGISDALIERFGDDAAIALNKISRQNAQRLGMIAEDGLLGATPRSPELLSVIRRYGDEAADFIWKNKGSLTVASVLGTFLADPKSFMTGAKKLVVDPIVARTNWTLIIGGVLVFLFLPLIARKIAAARAEFKRGPRQAP